MKSIFQRQALYGLLFCVSGLMLSRGFAADAETAVPDDLKKEMIQREEGMVVTTGRDPKVVAANIEKWTWPGYVMIVDGAPLARELFIAQTQEGKAPLTSVSYSTHDQNFVRSGDSIVVRGLYDRVWMVQGQPQEVKNAPFADTFAQVGGEWRCLSSFWSSKPTPPKPGG